MKTPCVSDRPPQEVLSKLEALVTVYWLKYRCPGRCFWLTLEMSLMNPHDLCPFLCNLSRMKIICGWTNGWVLIQGAK